MKRSTQRPTLLALLLASASAQAQYIDLPGTQPGELDGGIPIESARPCAVSCHSANDPLTTGAMPNDTWMGSMMGNTLRDPLFLAALTVAEQDRPGVGDWCLRCHTPAGFINGRTRGTFDAPRGERLDLEDRDGVTCDACHRMLPTPNLGNAQYVISPTETRFGPYPDIDSPRHLGAVSTWLADSRMCGTCHQVSNPLQPQRAADGRDNGQRFPLDTTFSEWSRSAFADSASPDARSCQDCHMPRIAGDGPVSTYVTAGSRNRPRRHEFAGANAWALRVLGAMRSELSAGDFYDPEAAPFYEAGARRAEEMLRGAVSLELRDAPASAAPGERVELVARITNRAGHRVPTGYADGRRVWIELALVDRDGRATVLSGAYDNAQARLTDDPQLALYEALHGRAGMGRGEHIALHDTVIRDTRLPPRGYRPLPGHEPVGADYSGGEAGALRHWDDRRYALTLPATARGSVTVRARARYQTTTREYVEFLARENRTDARGTDLLRRYEASGRAAPFTMAEATASIALRESASDASVPDVTLSDARATDLATTPPPAPPGGCGCHAPRPAHARWTTLLALLSLARRRRAQRSAQQRKPVE